MIAVAEVVTEIDGSCRFISTANTLGVDRMSLPESVAVERLVPTSSPTVVLARHRERLSAIQREVFVVMHDAADVFASVQRSNLVVAHYRKGIGPLTEDELKALVGRRLRAHEQELVDAVTQRWATRGGPPHPTS